MKKYKFVVCPLDPAGLKADALTEVTSLCSDTSAGQRNNTPPSKAKKRNRKGVRINFRLFTLFGNLPGLYKL